MTGPETRPPDYDGMERSIRTSRDRIDGTLDSLRSRIARLSPRHLMEQTMSRKTNRTDRLTDRDIDRDPDAYTTSGRTAMTSGSHSSSSSMMGMMRDNPIPLAMIGIGLGWLALSGSGYDRRIARSGAMRSVRHRAGDAAHYARETFYGAAESVRHAAGSAYESASDAVGSASETVRDQAGRLTGSGGGDWQPGRGTPSTTSSHSVGSTMHGATSRFWDVVEDHPLMAGVMGVALGAALGAAIPSTRYENRWVGDYADEATERAKALAKEALERGTRVAQTALETAKEEMSDAAVAVGEAARDEAKKPA